MMAHWYTTAELQELARDQVTDLTHLVQTEGKGGAKTPKTFFATAETANLFLATGETANLFLATGETAKISFAAAGSSQHRSSDG